MDARGFAILVKRRTLRHRRPPLAGDFALGGLRELRHIMYLYQILTGGCAQFHKHPSDLNRCRSIFGSTSKMRYNLYSFQSTVLPVSRSENFGYGGTILLHSKLICPWHECYGLLLKLLNPSKPSRAYAAALID